MELQDPCLSDYILALVLDYIYTGTLPYARSRQQTYSLLSAAHYLQMDELQRALRTEINTECGITGEETQPYKDMNSTKTANSYSDFLPLSDPCNLNSLEGRDQRYEGSDPHTRRSQNAASGCFLDLMGTDCSVAERTGVNKGNCQQVTHLTPTDLIKNIPRATKEHRASRVDKEVQKDQIHSAGTVKPESWQRSSEEELASTVGSKRSFYLLCSAEMQEEEAASVEKMQRLCSTGETKTEESHINRMEENKIQHSPLHGLSTLYPKDSVSLSQRASSSSPSSPHLFCGAVPVIRHSSTAAMAQVSTVAPQHPGAQVSSSRVSGSRSGSTDSDKPVCTTTHKHYDEAQNEENGNQDQSWDYTDHSDQCTRQDFSYESNADRPNILKPDYDSSNTDCDGFTDDNDHRDDCNSQDVLSNLNSDDFSSKYQPPDFHNICVVNHRSISSVPVSDSGKESETKVPRLSDALCEDERPKVQVKEEHSYLSLCAVTVHRQGSHCNSENDWYPNSHNAETTAEGAASCRHEHEDDDEDAATDIAPSHNSLEPEPSFTTLMDNNVSDPTNGVLGSYCGRLHYHCLPREDSSHRDSAPQHSHSNQENHSHDEEEEKQNFASTDQVIMLDISAKPAELLVSYRSDQKWAADAFESRFGDQDKEKQNGATFEERDRIARVKFGMEHIEDAEMSEDRKCSGGGRSKPGPIVIHRAGGVGGENQATGLTAGSPGTVSDSVQRPVSSTLPVCVPPTLSAGMQANISAHLSTPVHPFQCSLCERSFSQRGSLNRHVRSHLGVRPFPCPRCPMTFSRQYRVSEHMRVHQRCVLGSDFQKPPASSI